jgi:hypothetical protein
MADLIANFMRPTSGFVPYSAAWLRTVRPWCCYTVSPCVAKVHGEKWFHFSPTITRFMHLTH